MFALCGFWNKRKKGRERVGCVVKIIRAVIKTNIDLYLYFRKKIILFVKMVRDATRDPRQHISDPKFDHNVI